VVIKTVTNADTGTADIVGGDDWDAMAALVNENVHPFSYIIYKSGTNTKAYNSITQVATTGADSSTVIQNVLDALPATSGATLFFKAGTYSLTAKLQPPSYCSLTGEMEGGVSRLYVTGDYPAIELSAKTNVSIEKMYLTHSQSGYTSSLLNLKSGTGDCNFRGNYFYDFGTHKGNAIGIDATSASVYRHNFVGGKIDGFDNSFYANVANSSWFVNNCRFVNVNFYNVHRGLALNTVASAAFDDNTFTACEFQCYAGTLTVFDYETNHLGHSFYTVHDNVMVQDLPGATNYALVSAATEMTLIGCYPAWKIGGVGATSGKIRTLDVYTTKKGKSTQSGNGTTKIFNIAHALQAAPTSARVTAGSADAAGTPAVTFDATNIIVTYPIAPPSGSSNLIWNWDASVF
jgi:hypothetical protein